MSFKEANNQFPDKMKITTWPSAPDLTSFKRQDRKRHTIFVCFRSSITKKHWEPDSNHPICYGCQRKFTFFFRRHHCRRCGKVFCFACSGLKMRLDEDAQIGQEGYFHRVCFFCYKSKDSCIFNEQGFGKTTSLSRYFRKIRDKESLRSSFSLMTDTSRHQFTAEVVELCRPLITIFMKNKSSGGLAKPVKAVGGALLKTGREGVCNQCQNNIHIPTNRMQCKLCKQIYCKKCSSKRLAIVSDGTSKNQFDILLTDSFEELQQKYRHCELYRSCFECEHKVRVLLDRANFDKALDSLYKEMHHIQFDISEALTQQDGGIRSTSLERDNGIEMSGCLEIKDLNESFDLLTERDIMMEGSRISTNLINKFFDKYKTLQQLNSVSNPTTQARTKLITNIKMAMIDYYFETKPKILKPNSHFVATTAI